jgi:AraC-like DNA-binding protein
LLVGLFIFVSIYHGALTRTAIRYGTILKAKGDREILSRRRWISGVDPCLHAALIAFALSQILQIASHDMRWPNILINLGFVLVLLRLNFLLASQPFRTGQAAADAMRGSPRSGRTIMKDDDQTALICKKLEQVEAEGQLLFDPLLTMPKLAVRIGVTPNQLSHTLNNVLGQSFFEYVNSVRVHKAARLLCSEPERTILDIATEVGFNSKSTFNLAFKRVTGMTPSTYRVHNSSDRENSRSADSANLQPVATTGISAP